jgi:hypothetical protein
MSYNLTTEFYTNLDHAYAFFNECLWTNKLPPCLITLQRKKGAMGYYRDQAFVSEDGSAQANEIALNPESFGVGDAETLATLVHEMCHLWQYNIADEKPTRAYHDKIWAAEMKRVGLQPSSTGKVGGKETGWKMSDYPISGGAFEKARDELLASGYRVIWRTASVGDGGESAEGEAKKRSKTKFTCPHCGQNVWGKPGARVACADCSEALDKLVLMTSTDAVDENAENEEGRG